MLNTNKVGIPIAIKGLLRPHLVRVLSDKLPIVRLPITPTTPEKLQIKPACQGLRPTMVVRKKTRYALINWVNPVPARLPMEKAIFPGLPFKGKDNQSPFKEIFRISIYVSLSN
jgi:hypothetical protein